MPKARAVRFLVAAAICATVLLAGAMSPAAPPAGIATYAYITNASGNGAGIGATVSVIDIATDTVVTSVTLTGNTPYFVAAAPDGSRVYVAMAGSSSVSRIDTATNTEIGTLTVGTQPGNQALGIAATPDGTRLYVANLTDNTVSVISTATNTVTGAVPVGSHPWGVAVTPDGARVYVANQSDNTVSVIATATNTVIATVPVGNLPRGVAVTPDGTRVYVTNYHENDVAVISTATNTVTGYVPAGDHPHGVAVTPDGARVYVSNEISNDVSVISTATNTVTATVPVGASPIGLGVTPDGTRVFVANGGATTVSVIATLTNTVIDTVTVGIAPRAFGLFFVQVAAAPPPPPLTPVLSYFLPRNINLKLKGAGKDSLIAAGFYDDGGPLPDYTQPVTITVGTFTRTFTLVPKGKGFFSPKDPVVNFFILPNLRGSSRGRFEMQLSKTTLTGLIDPNAAVPFHFTASGLPDAQGSVLLTAGRYKLGKKRGALVSPQFFPQRAAATVGAANADALVFVGSFATNATTPAALTSVRFAFGPTFVRTIPGSQFTKKGDAFTFKDKQGTTTFSIKLDFLRETVTVAAKKAELGNLDTGTIDIDFDAGAGAGGFRNTVRIASNKANRYY